METVNESNTYIQENNLTNQIETYSLIGIDKVSSDEEIELYEDVDFIMDYDKKELVFPILNIDGKNSRLTQGDLVTIVYTPNIEETGISIGYHVTRTDLSHNIRLKPNYIEHKI